MVKNLLRNPKKRDKLLAVRRQHTSVAIFRNMRECVPELLIPGLNFRGLQLVERKTGILNP
jgi:hypothetical protein